MFLYGTAKLAGNTAALRKHYAQFALGVIQIRIWLSQTEA